MGVSRWELLRALCLLLSPPGGQGWDPMGWSPTAVPGASLFLLVGKRGCCLVHQPRELPSPSLFLILYPKPRSLGILTDPVFFFPWILYFLQPVKRPVGLKTTSLHPQISFTLPLIVSQITDAQGFSATHLSLFWGDCLVVPGWRWSRSGLLPCRDDRAGPGSSQNPGKTSSGKQPVCTSGAVPCRGQREPSSGRILLFPELYSKRDAPAVMERDRAPRTWSPGCRFRPPGRFPAL